jgi:hypothetical protein
MIDASAIAASYGASRRYAAICRVFSPPLDIDTVFSLIIASFFAARPLEGFATYWLIAEGPPYAIRAAAFRHSQTASSPAEGRDTDYATLRVSQPE